MRTIIAIFLLVYSIFPCIAGTNEGESQSAFINLRIKELHFNEDSSWTIHLDYQFRELPLSGYHTYKIDSVLFCSFKGNAWLKHVDYIVGNKQYSDSVFIIIKDSLLGNLNIDNVSDSLTVVNYCEIDNEKLIIRIPLVYGNYKTSHISPLRIGQSVIEYGGCKMNNSNSHYLGTLKGKIYDAKGNIFKGFNAEWVSIEIDSIGNFETQRWARIDTLKQIGYKINYTDNTIIVPIKSIPYNVEPDSVYYADIHILDPANITNSASNYSQNLVFPNPVVDISYLENPGQFDILEIYNASGNKIKIITIKNQVKVPINKNEYIPGIYFYRILCSKSAYLTGKFVVN